MPLPIKEGAIRKSDKMADGEKLIEQIQVGDVVLSDNPNNLKDSSVAKLI